MIILYPRYIWQALAAICAFSLLPTAAHAKPQFAQPDIRTIRFPDCAVGSLKLIRKKDCGLVRTSELLPPPKGEVKITVPAEDYLELEISGAAVRHPDCLRQMSGRGIDSVAIRNISSFEDGKSDANTVTRNLVHFGDLQSILFERADVTDDALSMIKNFPRLKSIRFSVVEGISGASFPCFASCPKLSTLNLSVCAGIRNENLKCLPTLRNLRELHIIGMKLNAIGIKYVSQCSNLRVLDLRNTGISDEGLLQLQSLKKLEYLNLTKCPVTARGLSALAPLKLKSMVIPSYVFTSAQALGTLKSALPGTKIDVVHESDAAVQKSIMKWFSR